MPTDVSSAERLAYWYLRLNGFFMLENFVIHPDTGTNQRTDADLVGIRFRYRNDRMDEVLEDDPIVAASAAPCNVIIAEVKRGRCELNGPWTRPDDENIQRLLRAIGCFPEGMVHDAAHALYETGRFADGLAECRLLAFGDQPGDLPTAGVDQILFSHAIDFIYDRLRRFRRQKSSVGNWAKDGQKLREFAVSADPAAFRANVRAYFQVG